MIKRLLHRTIGKFERDWNYDASYLHDMIDASPRAAWMFSRVAAMGQFRRDVPVEAWCAAGITAVRHEDCGPCTQLAVTMAERAGVSADVLRAVLADRTDIASDPQSRVVSSSSRSPARSLIVTSGSRVIPSAPAGSRGSGHGDGDRRPRRAR